MNGSLIGLMGLPGGMEWVVIAVVGLLLFGRRLPSAARAMGSSIVEFRKGLKGTIEEAGLAEARSLLKSSIGDSSAK
jgi:sec-independent protein translocase protein TatA